MDKARLFSLLLVLVVGVRVVFVDNLEYQLLCIASALGGMLMIWYADYFAEYWLGFGFWESKAKDFKQAHRQGPIIAFLGWLGLLAIVGFVLFMTPTV